MKENQINWFSVNRNESENFNKTNQRQLTCPGDNNNIYLGNENTVYLNFTLNFDIFIINSNY